GVLSGDNKYRRTPLPIHKFNLLPLFALHLATTVDEAQLLTEREAHKRELTRSLEQESATSEILRMISQSQRDVQPVFEAIAANARKLCEGTRAAVYVYDGELIKYAAGDTVSSGVLQAIQQTFPIPPGRGGATARAILTRAVAYIPDVSEDPEYEL